MCSMCKCETDIAKRLPKFKAEVKPKLPGSIISVMKAPEVGHLHITNPKLQKQNNKRKIFSRQWLYSLKQ